MFVQGQIVPTQGTYIIALNVNLQQPDGTIVDVNPNEAPGQPTIQEAQLGTYTHWDQAVFYGVGYTQQPAGFAYAYKALNTVGGSHAISFVPIILNAGDYIFIPNASNGTGNGNVLQLRLPITDLSIRANPSGTNPPTIATPPAYQIYVNYMTLDATQTPQDQLGCCGLNSTGYQLVIPLTGTPQTYISQLTPPPTKQGPLNPNLFITGGEIIVNPTPTAAP
jgi:hypothetical protein